MEKVQIQFQISAEAMAGLRAAAEKKGITPGILARLIMHEHFEQPDEESKSYTFTIKNWREVEAYVEAKRLGSVEVFVGFAMEQYLTRYPPSEGQKRQIEKSIGNADTPGAVQQVEFLGSPFYLRFGNRVSSD
jgi:hypothetical protein